MTREQLIKHWDVIKAFKEGKEVELLYGGGNWGDCPKPEFQTDMHYRVKQEPEYVPFDFSDAEKLIGRIVVHKDKKELGGIHQITSIKNDYLYFYNGGCNMNYLFKYFTFLDGSPCGKIKE